MLLIIEIALVVAAWKKGWKALALIPVAIPLCMGMAIGAATGPSGMSEGTLLAALPLDVLCIVVLAVMAKRGRQTLPTTGPSAPGAVA